MFSFSFGYLFAIQRERKPELIRFRLRRKVKPCRHDAYYRVVLPTEPKNLINNLRIGIEPSLPQGVAQEDDATPFITRQKDPSQQRFDSDGGEQIHGHFARGQTLRWRGIWTSVFQIGRTLKEGG